MDSTNYWANKAFEVSENDIKELCQREHEELISFVKAQGLDLCDVAKYLSSLDATVLEDVLEQSLSGSTPDADTIISIIEEKFKKLKDAYLDATNIELGLYYPAGEIVSGVDKVYWVAENAMIKNPELDGSKIYYFETISKED